MARISNGKLKVFTGFIMTIVMVISLFAGIGAIFVAEETTAASAVGTGYKDGKYDIPTSASGVNKGESGNPYVVLEIVPDANRSQFGYLVKGQEPVDMLGVALDPHASDYAAMLERYLDLDVADKDINVSEFNSVYKTGDLLSYTVNEGGTPVNKTVKLGDSGFIWKTNMAATQYGEYTLNSSDNGSYALVEERKLEKVGYAVYEQTDLTEEIPTSYKQSDPGAAVYYPSVEEAQESVADKLHVSLDDCITNGYDLFAPVGDKNGLYSSRLYTYVGENKGPYSLLKKYVGAGGDLDIKETLGQVDAFTTTNNIINELNNFARPNRYEDRAYHGSSRGFGDQGNKRQFKVFKRITDEAADVATYSIKAYSNNVYNSNSSSNTQYYKYYKAVPVNGDDYDFSENKNARVAISEIIKQNAETEFETNGYIKNLDSVFYSISVGGYTFSVSSQTISRLPGGVTELWSDKDWERDDYYIWYNDDNFFYYDEWRDTIYKYEYTYNRRNAKNYNITIKYQFEYDNGNYTQSAGDNHYVVIFTYDPDGKFVVDPTKTGTFYTNYNYHMAYTPTVVDSGEEAKWEWIPKNSSTPGEYKDIAGTVEIPQPVFNPAKPSEKINGREMVKLGISVHLGEYTEYNYIENGQPLSSENDDGTKKIYSKDYQRFVIVPVYKNSDTFSYKIEETSKVTPSTGVITILGTYDWTGYNLADSNTISADTSKLDSNINGIKDEYEPLLTLKVSGDPQQFEDSVPGLILGYKENQSYFIGYLGGYKNYDLFKKFSVGLAFNGNDRTKDSDVDSYEFVEWCTDENGMNPFTESMAVNGDITLYAKWLIKYPEDLSEIGESRWSGYTIKFEPNAPEGETVSHMPGIATEKTVGEGEDATEITEYLVTGISRNAKISAPDYKPVREKYLFTGWYIDAACSTPFDYSKELTDEYLRSLTPGADESTICRTLTLYAGWEPIGTFDTITKYSFSLNSNTVLLPNGTKVTMPADTTITDIAVNGKQYAMVERDKLDEDGNPVMNPETGEPVKENVLAGSDVTITDPVADRDNYSFAGWYLDRACKHRFDFVPEVIETLDSTKTTVLYAKWIFKDPADPATRPQYTVTYNGNKPKGAVAAVQNLTPSFVYCGDTLSYSARPEASLAGNIDAKLDAYNIQVVTVTPDDFVGANKDNNLKLIDRADLIVINETCEENDDPNIPDMLDLYELYHSSSDAWYNTHHSSGVKSFADKDLSWEAVMRILSRITGVVYDSVQRKNVKTDYGTCPVLFDEKICDNCLKSTTLSKNISFDGKNADKVGLSTGSQKSSKANIYKLYLMTQVASPVTIYNAFFAGRTGLEVTEVSGTGKISSSDASKYTFPISGNDDAAVYWNPYTLVPYSVIDISEDDWDDAGDDKTNALSLVGFDLGVKPDSGKSRIRNRMFIYNSYSGGDPKKNLISDYLSLVTLELQNTKDLKYFKEIIDNNKSVSDSEPLVQTGYTASEIFYFMIHGDTLYNNLERDINILEIQPASYSHTDEYWFWYISNFAPNVTGKITGHPMSSSEFQCNIDDLNSKYDVIFMGTQTEIKDLDGNKINVSMDAVIPNGPSGHDLAYYHTGNTATYSYYSVGSFNSVSEGTVTNDDMTTTAAYSGNDFTFAKYQAVAEFLTAKYPIIFDKGFFAGDTDTINVNKIDSASWIYKMANEVVTKKDDDGGYTYKWFKEGTDQKDEFLEALLHKTFKLEVVEKPVEYHDRTRAEYSTYPDDRVYINGGDITNKNKRVLEYKIKINSVKTDEKYKVKLIIDTNGDGKYNLSTEQLDSIEIYDTVSGHSGTSNNMKLQSGRTYKISRRLTEDYAGLIPWKLQIVALDSAGKETAVRDEVTGLSAIQIENRAKIYVLQIISESANTGTMMSGGTNYGYRNYPYGSPTIYLPEDAEIYEAYTKRGNKTINQFSTAPTQNGKANETAQNDYFNYSEGSGYSYTKSKFRTNTGTDDTDILSNAAWFHYYTNDLQEFEVHFVRATAAEVNAIAAAKKLDKNAKGDSLGKVYSVVYYKDGDETGYRLTNGTDLNPLVDSYDPNDVHAPVDVYWDDIDMLILGFADHYNSKLEENEDGRKLVQDFIEAGKTTLFTFDTTTDVRWSDKSTYKRLSYMTSLNYPYVGYNMATTFADLLGQDKFGVYQNHGIQSKVKNPTKKGGDGTTYSISSINLADASKYELKYDIPFAANGEMKLSNLLTTEKITTNGTETKYINRTWGYQTVYKTKRTGVQYALTQGFSKNALRTTGYSAVFTATQTNEGQIVRYPYEVGQIAGNGKNTFINIAKTHAQWLQLNMEDDDIVVWFSLFSKYRTDNDGNWYHKDNDDTTTTDPNKAALDKTQNIINDGTNNYYIYNKGNVTFSGVGMADTKLSDDEYRLFVNTMLASFRARAKATEPRIQNPDRSESTEDMKYYLYVDYDATSSLGSPESKAAIPGSEIVTMEYVNAAGETETCTAKRVFFTLYNDSIVEQKSMTVHYYPVIYDTATGTKVILYDVPMDADLQTKRMEGEKPNPATDPEIKSIKQETAYTYDMPDDKPKTDPPIMYDGVEIKYHNIKNDILVPEGAGAMDSGDNFYVDIPIELKYYEDLLAKKKNAPGNASALEFDHTAERTNAAGVSRTVNFYKYTYTYKNDAGAKPTTSIIFAAEDRLGLDAMSKFEIDIQVVMRYGRDKSKNPVLVGTRGVVFMRRGMFTLD